MSERIAEARDREEFTVAVRRAALARCGGRCEGCGKPLVGRRYTYDHTLPWRRGGLSTLENCKVLCNDGKDSCDYRKTYGEDLPGIAAVKRYGKNRLPLDIDRPAKKPSTFRGKSRPIPRPKNFKWPKRPMSKRQA